jgi:hypothetical protein
MMLAFPNEEHPSVIGSLSSHGLPVSSVCCFYYFILSLVPQRILLVVFGAEFMISYLLVFCREKEKWRSGLGACL